MRISNASVHVALLDPALAGLPATDDGFTRVDLEIADGRIVSVTPDLVLFAARDFSQLLARPQSDRRVLRAGAFIDTTLPDYRELDDLVRHR